MTKEHYETEKNHLIVMSYILPKNSHSKLLILWRILGFGLGFFLHYWAIDFLCNNSISGNFCRRTLPRTN